MKICVKGDFGEVMWELPLDVEKKLEESISDISSEEKRDELRLMFISGITSDVQQLLTLEWVALISALNNDLRPTALLNTAMNMAKDHMLKALGEDPQ